MPPGPRTTTIPLVLVLVAVAVAGALAVVGLATAPGAAVDVVAQQDGTVDGTETAGENETTTETGTPMPGGPETETVTVTDTPGPGGPETTNATPTEELDTETPTPTESDGQPGFGVLLAFVGLVAALLLARRSR